MRKMNRFVQNVFLLSVVALMTVIFLYDVRASSPDTKDQESKLALSGQILINVYDYEHFVFEFSLKPPDQKIIKTYESEPKYVKDARSEDKAVLYSPVYQKIFDENLWYGFEKKHELQEALGAYNLDQLGKDKLRKEKSKENQYQYYLVPVENQNQNFYSRLLYPNKQFTHVVSLSGSEEVLINLSTKEVSFPFSDKPRISALYGPVWNVKGDAVAYISRIIMGELYAVAVVNVFTHKSILRKELGEVIDCLAFSPDDRYLAVMRSTKRPSFWPYDFLLLMASHGIYYHTYYLEIFDLRTGNQVYSQRLQGSYKNAKASVVWIKGKLEN